MLRDGDVDRVACIGLSASRVFVLLDRPMPPEGARAMWVGVGTGWTGTHWCWQPLEWLSCRTGQ